MTGGGVRTRGARKLTVMQITRDYPVTVLGFFSPFIYGVNAPGCELQRGPKRPDCLTDPKTVCLREVIPFVTLV